MALADLLSQNVARKTLSLLRLEVLAFKLTTWIVHDLLCGMFEKYSAHINVWKNGCAVKRELIHIYSKSISYGVWCPTIARTHVTLGRGIHFNSLGHSVSRLVGDSSKTQKRLELLPEESLYLVERGALFCTKESHGLKSNIPGGEDVEGVPMSVQQAFAEMIGKEDLTSEKYQVRIISSSPGISSVNRLHQVYAYLKRLGFSITRATPPSPSYPSVLPFSKHNLTPSLIRRLFSWIAAMTSRLQRLFSPGFNWWKPVQLRGWLYHDKCYRMSLSYCLIINPR